MRSYLKQIVIVLMISICGLFFCGCDKESDVLLGHDAQTTLSVAEEKEKDSANESSGQRAESSAHATEEQNTPHMLYVYICGEVINPGVYEMSSQERVCTLIQRAGGLTEQADLKAVNQAQLLEDGQMVYIPSTEEAQEMPAVSAGAGVSSTSGQSEGRININSASQEELKTLPGIGAGKAANIVSYREAHGKFKSVEELMNVDGIKEGTYEKLKDRITV